MPGRGAAARPPGSCPSCPPCPEHGPRAARRRQPRAAAPMLIRAGRLEKSLHRKEPPTACELLSGCPRGCSAHPWASRSGMCPGDKMDTQKHNPPLHTHGGTPGEDLSHSPAYPPRGGYRTSPCLTPAAGFPPKGAGDQEKQKGSICAHFPEAQATPCCRGVENDSPSVPGEDIIEVQTCYRLFLLPGLQKQEGLTPLLLSAPREQQRNGQ